MMARKTFDQILENQIQILADWNDVHKNCEGSESEQVCKNVEVIVLVSRLLSERGH